MILHVQKLTEWLLFGLIDFDFISESLWKSQTPDDALLSDEAFFVGKVKYETILVPNCLTLRSSTLERLKVFQKKGEELSFWENFPGLLMRFPVMRQKFSARAVKKYILPRRTF